MIIPAPLTMRRVSELLEWIDAVPCHELSLPSLDRGVELIRHLLDAGRG